jgi:two-component system response regulator RegA
VVDDDDVFRERLGRAIAGRGYAVRTAANADEAVALATQAPPRFAVLDLRMPGDDGLVVLRRLRELAPDLRAVMLTGHGNIATVMEAVHLGAVNYLTKPADVDDVLAALNPEGQAARKGVPGGTTSLEQMAWKQLHRIMQESGGDVHEAVRRLGMSRRTLQRRAFRHRPDR